MEERDLYRLRLPEEKETVLLQYVSERRYSFMMMLYLSLAGSLLLLPLAIYDFKNLVNPGYYGYSYRYRRNRSGYILIFWIMCIASFIVSFIRGIGKTFGMNSDFDCLKNQKYAFGTMILGGKKHDAAKHPYYVSDRDGNEYCCPIFLDYKNAKFGDEMFCIILDNGTRYALCDVPKPGWDLESPKQ